MTHASELLMAALPDFPQVGPGDDLATLTVEAMTRSELRLRATDVLVFAQKIISKTEGRRIDLASVTPGEPALERACGKERCRRRTVCPTRQ